MPAPQVTNTVALPSVGIVLPTYNGQAYLAEAISSVISQTYAAIDLVVVDDGSTDDTATISERFAAADPRVRVLHNGRNLGVARSLNRGFGTLDNPLITWTSDDNILDRRMIERLVSGFQVEPGLDLIYAGVRHIDGSGKWLKDVLPQSPEHLSIHNAVMACFLFRRRILEQIGGYSTFWELTSDYDYWLRVRAAGFRIKVLGEILYSWRMHPRSLTSRHRRKVALMSVALRNRDWRNGRPMRDAMREKAMIRLAADVLRLGTGSREMKFAAAAARRVSTSAKVKIYYRMLRASIKGSHAGLQRSVAAREQSLLQ